MTDQHVQILLLVLNTIVVVGIAGLGWFAKRIVTRIDCVDKQLSIMNGTVQVLNESKDSTQRRLEVIETRCWDCLSRFAQIERNMGEKK